MVSIPARAFIAAMRKDDGIAFWHSVFLVQLVAKSLKYIDKGGGRDPNTSVDDAA